MPQREKDIEQAKQLLADAGMPDGFTVKMNTQRAFEIPDLGVLIQNGAKETGITIELVLQDSGTYYGDAVYGKSPWLDSVMGITDYGHRGVPNVFLGAPLKSDGTWNTRALQEHGVRRPGRRVHGGARHRRAAGGGEQDRDAPARRDADHLPLLLQLPDRDGEERRRRRADRDGPRQPVRDLAQLIARPGGPALRRAAGLRHHRMARFLLKRLGLALITLSLLSVMVFFWRSCCRATSAAASSARSPTSSRSPR